MEKAAANAHFGKTKQELRALKQKREKQQRKRQKAKLQPKGQGSTKPRAKAAIASAPRRERLDKIKVMLHVAWIGTDFCGWQPQPNEARQSLQAALSEAVFKATGEANLDPAGRTDKGVHAACQCVQAAFRMGNTAVSPGEMAGLPAAVNQHLGALPMRVLSAELKDAGWTHRSATGKRYCYYLRQGRAGGGAGAVGAAAGAAAGSITGGGESITGGGEYELDVGAMHAAAQSLVGTRDFRFLG
jgi:tRNA pseudouridine(38-40) synthase